MLFSRAAAYSEKAAALFFIIISFSICGFAQGEAIAEHGGIRRRGNSSKCLNLVKSVPLLTAAIALLP